MSRLRRMLVLGMLSRINSSPFVAARASKTPSATAWEEIRDLGNAVLLDMLPDGKLVTRSAASQQRLQYSSDDGATWQDIYYNATTSNTFFPSVIISGRTMGDGSFVVCLFTGDIYRSPNPLTTSFSKVLTLENTAAWPRNQYGSFVYGQYAFINEYGAEPSNNAYFSGDYGATWAKVFTLPADAVPADQHHIHNVAYDPYDDLLWVCSGDSGNKMIYYSRDHGDNWTQLGVFGAFGSTGNMIQIIPLPECILFTTDAATSGAYKLRRRANPVYGINDFELAYTVATVAGSLPIGSRPAVAYGDDACTYFSYEFYSSSQSNDLSHIYATRDGMTFFDIAEPAYTPTGSGTFGITCLVGPAPNGYIYGQHNQASARYLIRVQAPTWS